MPASLRPIARRHPVRLGSAPHPLRLAVLLLLLGWHGQGLSWAGSPVAFTVDPARSRIALSGNLAVPGVGTYTFQPQGVSSLNASYTGTLLAELASPNLRFPGGSVIQANNTGSWQPGPGGILGVTPADYGIFIQPLWTTMYAALRNLQLDLVSPATPLANGRFDAGQLVTIYLTNATPPPSMDYYVHSTLLPSLNTNGTALLSGTGTNSASTAWLTNGAGLLTLVLPVNTTNVSTLGSYVITVILQGQVVATAPASAWPLQAAIAVQAGQVTLSWPSLPGQSFSVETTQDLGSAWGPASGSLTVQANTTTWTATSSGSIRFYRVVGSF